MCCGQKRSNLQQSPLSSARQNAHKVGNSRSQAVRTQPSMPLPAGNVSSPTPASPLTTSIPPRAGQPDVAVCRPSLCGELTHPSARTREWCELRVFGHSRRSGSGRQRRLLFVEHSFFPSRLKVWFVYRLLFVERAEVLLRRERDVGDRLLVVGVWISRERDRPADGAPDEALLVSARNVLVHECTHRCNRLLAIGGE